jgi:putative endonuclease
MPGVEHPRPEPTPRSLAGFLAEEAVAKWLAGEGYSILDRNFSVPRIGELDIVAIRNGALHIVEVRARRQGSRFGTGADSITPAKLRRIRNTAAIYMARKQLLNNDVYLLAADVALDSRGDIVSICIIPMQ